jgi:predicted metalloprotease
MKWTPGSVSEDIEDRRGGGGGFRGGPVSIGVVLVLLVLSLLTGKNFLSLVDSGAMQGGGAPADQSGAPVQSSAEEEKLVQFVSFVLDDAQHTWQQLLPGYRKAKLVLFRDTTDTACGLGQTASGPFYCPGDEKVYLDLGFFDELRTRFGASGEFAEAYVITHEIGHHVQRLRGIEGQVRQLQESRPGQANELSVRLELQADCYAGIWGHSTAQRNILEQGDVESALTAAASIGDDRIQRMSGRAVHPESFTHGSSQDRVAWFKRGLDNGDLGACDTFRGGT